MPGEFSAAVRSLSLTVTKKDTGTSDIVVFTGSAASDTATLADEGVTLGWGNDGDFNSPIDITGASITIPATAADGDIELLISAVHD